RRNAGGPRLDGDDHSGPLHAAGTVSRRRTRVAVLLGGRSSEHEISLASARSLLEALDPKRYETVTVEIGRDGRWELGTGSDDGSVAETLPVPTSKVPATLGEVDVVFPVLHGPFGEDGTVQGLLELAGVPYVGAGVAASALCMDKDLFKCVMRDHGIPVARNITLREGDALENPFGYPVFVKPARLGSSVVIPPRITDEQTARVQELSAQAFVATECEGMARADCFVREDGEVLVNELNTIPGFTATSVYAKLFEASGVPYADLLERLIELA